MPSITTRRNDEEARVVDYAGKGSIMFHISFNVEFGHARAQCAISRLQVAGCRLQGMVRNSCIFEYAKTFLSCIKYDVKFVIINK